ncbi:MAG: hypothetical protein JW797_09945 [Bradymonadales bacterium]|nr:hypothetical protein [Bradymonadales bacterium]
MSRSSALRGSCALWNRSHLDLRSSETIAQILDRGELEAWRELYQLCRTDQELRSRVLRVVTTVPLPFGHFWLAALANLGEAIDLAMPLPSDREDT